MGDEMMVFVQLLVHEGSRIGLEREQRSAAAQARRSPWDLSIVGMNARHRCAQRHGRRRFGASSHKRVATEYST